MLRFGDALGLIPLAIGFPATVVDADPPILAQAIARFGLYAVALEEHRQARQFVPGALVLLQVYLHGARRFRVIA
ncbi:hypothetical protein D3C76_1697490 [compost metagenome]